MKNGYLFLSSISLTLPLFLSLSSYQIGYGVDWLTNVIFTSTWCSASSTAASPEKPTSKSPTTPSPASETFRHDVEHVRIASEHGDGDADSATDSVEKQMVGLSFPHKPVIFNPQVEQMQALQAYYHPNGPQYGQQMLVGHPRQAVYLPNFQPELPYKGQDY